ncbi:MAG: hypothetical protein Q8M31_00035 [Beijerinckiaceae bacterium]|nr:hypothetical protein [Beijerinckiaceae bacterium]
MNDQTTKLTDVDLDAVSGGTKFADVAAGMASAGVQRGARRVAQSVGKCPPNHNGV